VVHKVGKRKRKQLTACKLPACRLLRADRRRALPARSAAPASGGPSAPARPRRSALRRSDRRRPRWVWIVGGGVAIAVAVAVALLRCANELTPSSHRLRLLTLSTPLNAPGPTSPTPSNPPDLHSSRRCSWCCSTAPSCSAPRSSWRPERQSPAPLAAPQCVQTWDPR